MASYHLSVKSVSRATGRSAPAAAAYRTATRIENERDGLVHDYTRRGGVDAAFLVVPEGAVWAEDRAALWNAAEGAEKRRDAKVAREYELALPHELGREERHQLAGEFAREVVARFGVAADVAIHEPGQEGDQRNWHAHILTTTRVVSAGGLGAKTRELDVTQTSGPAVEALRELWGHQVNRALARAQVAERVDHQSFTRRGEDLVAEQHMGPAATAMERRAERERVQAAERAPEAGRMAPESSRNVSAIFMYVGESRDENKEASLAPEPVTRIGQHNAGVRERNRVWEVAQQAVEKSREGLNVLEQRVRAGVRWIGELARGLGTQIVGEREAKAREAEQAQQELQRQAEMARQEAIQQEVEQKNLIKPTRTHADVWQRVTEEGQKARQADRERQGEKPEHEQITQRPRGPSIGR